MPETEKDIWEWIKGCKLRQTETMCLIESVHAMPGNGVSSMFKFGKGYGGLRMALVAAGISFEEVSPMKWMKEFGLKRGKTESKNEFKKRIRAKAQALFPQENGSITLATCDALLISEYCRRKYG